MKKSKLMSGLITTAAVVAFSLPTIASADSGPTFKGASEKVQYAPTDIEKQEGLEKLYRNLQAASKRVCGVESPRVTGSVKFYADGRRCYRDSLNSAVAKVNNEALTNLHIG